MPFFSADISDFVRLVVNRIGNLVKRRGRVKIDEKFGQKILASRANSSVRKRGKYILLNDTAALGNNQHLGCNAVTGLIHQNLSDAGFECKMSINEFGDINKPDFSLDDVCLVIMNGEGSVHHDNNRVLGLMEIAKLAKRAGIATALVNCVWQHNSMATGGYLEYFDIVSVRERQSYDALKKYCPQARVIPDMSIKVFSKDKGEGEGIGQSAAAVANDFVVIDSMKAAIASKLLGFANRVGAPMFYMGNKHNRFMTGAGAEYNVGEQIYPRPLDNAVDLSIADCCLTGRYHGAVAALSMGMKVAAVSSNTHKMQAMFEDIGILDVAMLERKWLSLSVERQREMLEEKFAKWDSNHRDKVDTYIKSGCQQIDLLFADITKLAGN